MKGTSVHVALELTHVEPVDQWSGKGKADGVWHIWERAGQRHDALKRVAQTPECRFLFTVHMQDVSARNPARVSLAAGLCMSKMSNYGLCEKGKKVEPQVSPNRKVALEADR